MSQYKHFASTQFKNGNLNLRIEKKDLDEFNQDRQFFLEDLLWWMNCVFVGETYCLNKSETARTIYNGYMDYCYVFPWSELETLAQGKTVKLIARPVTDEDWAWIKVDWPL